MVRLCAGFVVHSCSNTRQISYSVKVLTLTAAHLFPKADKSNFRHFCGSHTEPIGSSNLRCHGFSSRSEVRLSRPTDVCANNISGRGEGSRDR